MRRLQTKLRFMWQPVIRYTNRLLKKKQRLRELYKQDKTISMQSSARILWRYGVAASVIIIAIAASFIYCN